MSVLRWQIDRIIGDGGEKISKRKESEGARGGRVDSELGEGGANEKQPGHSEPHSHGPDGPLP